MKKKMKIYFANALFSQAEREFNKNIVEYLRNKNENLDIYLPQENDAINDKTNSATSIEIYDADTEELKNSDILIACIDGVITDIGTATEVGYFAGMIEHGAKDKKIIALSTDSRDPYYTMSESKFEAMNEDVLESQFVYINLYLIGAIKKHGVILKSRDELLNYLNAHYKNNEK